MNDTDKQSKPNHETRVNLAFGITMGEWLIAGITGLSSAIVTGAATIRKDFIEEVKNWPGIDSLITRHEKDLDKCNQSYLDGHDGGWKEHQRAINKVKVDYAAERDSILKTRYEIESRGFKGLTYGTWQRLGFAGKSTEGRILFNSTIGAVVGAAMTLSFFNGVASRHKIELIADSLDEHKQTRG